MQAYNSEIVIKLTVCHLKFCYFKALFKFILRYFHNSSQQKKFHTERLNKSQNIIFPHFHCIYILWARWNIKSFHFPVSRYLSSVKEAQKMGDEQGFCVD